MADVITSIKCDLDHDKVMIEGLENQIKELEMKLEYYKGKFDGRNEAFGIINGREK